MNTFLAALTVFALALLVVRIVGDILAGLSNRPRD